ncbi:hypothetical protein Gogos_015708, partial [Gossypium gossypioides]|nr:hypothetical protein [Gossypium gossypioides]
ISQKTKSFGYSSTKLSKSLLPTTNVRTFLNDLSRNYLSGPIPREWGSSTRLVYIILENNGLLGTLPEALGNLSKVERL